MLILIILHLKNQDCSLGDGKHYTKNEMETIITTFFGLYDDANACMSMYDDGDRSYANNNNGSSHLLCKNCAILYKNVSNFFSQEIVMRAAVSSWMVACMISVEVEEGPMANGERQPQLNFCSFNLNLCRNAVFCMTMPLHRMYPLQLKLTLWMLTTRRKVKVKLTKETSFL